MSEPLKVTLPPLVDWRWYRVDFQYADGSESWVTERAYTAADAVVQVQVKVQGGTVIGVEPFGCRDDERG